MLKVFAFTCDGLINDTAVLLTMSQILIHVSYWFPINAFLHSSPLRVIHSIEAGTVGRLQERSKSEPKANA